MASRTSWSDLLPGLAAIVALIAIVAAVLLFSGVGGVRGSTVHFFVATDQARGVMRGTEVWVAGQKVGVVESVGFAPPSADSGARVVIAIEVRETDIPQIRRESPAQVRAGLNVVAPSVVYLEAGTPSSPAARPGDTLRARTQSDIELAATRLTAASAELKPLLADARTVISLASDPDGTIGAARRDVGGGRGGLTALTHLRTNGSHLLAEVAGMRESYAALIPRARAALARADSIRALIARRDLPIGAMGADTTLGARIASVRDELIEVRAQLARDDGALARFGRDSAIVRAVADAQREMALLFEDVKRRPFRYLSLP